MYSPTLVSLAIAIAVTQVATFSTTIYLHRSATHRALTLHPVVAWLFRIRALDHDRVGHEGVGRGPSKAPCIYRRGGRSAQPAIERLLAGPARQRVLLHPRGAQPCDRHEVRVRHHRRSMGPGDVQSRLPRSTARHSHAVWLARRWLGTARGRRARRDLCLFLIVVYQRPVPFPRLSDVRQHGHQYSLAGALYGR